MQYFGGKSKIAKYIVPYLEEVRKEGQVFVEPFVGGANIVSKMSGERKAYDFNEYLIEMYKGVQNGYELPDELSEETYKHIRLNKDEDKVLTGFVGFGCSFAGKWFGCYARGHGGKLVYADTSKRSLLKKMETMSDVEFGYADYKTLSFQNCLIYCDPPYKNTTKFTGTPDFNTEEFWDVMREWSKENDVYISEYEAPDDFTSVLDIPTKTSIRDATDNACERIEKLFTIKKKKLEDEMELRIEKITFPEVIDFNFEELKQEITNRVAMYANMVYTEDQVKQAKTDRANLNKFVKALSDERIKVKKQCMKPYEEFEAKVNELSKIVQEPIKMIDKQVKEYEEQKKQEKLNEITYYFNSTDHPEWLHISKIMSEKWLNASVSMKSIQEEINSRIEQIKNDVAALSNLPEFGFEATEVYKTTLDINKALNEGHRLSEIQKRKAEHEAEQARLKAEAEAKISEVAEKAHGLGTASYGEVMEAAKSLEDQFKVPAKQWVSFAALLSVEDGKALKAFFESRNIEFKAI